MSYSFSFLLLILISSFHHMAFSYNLLSCNCSKESVAITDYKDNRAAVLEDLKNNMDSNDGYYNASEHRQSRVEIIAFALCRGDVPSKDCLACISEAADNIKKTCNDSREGVIWYDYCSLKYSDENFIGVLDTNYEFNTTTTNYVKDSNFTSVFYTTTRDFMIDLSSQAYNNISTMFARGKQGFAGTGMDIHGMAQCTRDLSPDFCKDCLQEAVKKLMTIPDGINGTIVSVPDGATYYTPNCMVKYDTNSFLLTDDSY